MKQESQIYPNIQNSAPEQCSGGTSLHRKNESSEKFIVEMQSLKNNPERHLLSQQNVDKFVENFLALIYKNRDHPEKNFDERKIDIEWWALYHPRTYEKKVTEAFDLFKKILNTADYDYDYQNISFAEKCLKSCIEKADKFPYEAMMIIDLIINSADWINDSDGKDSENKPKIRESLILDSAIIVHQKTGISGDVDQILINKLTELFYGDSNDEDDFYYDNYEHDSERYDPALTEAGSHSFMLFNTLKEYLDFSDQKNFSRAAATLSVLNDVARTKRSGTSTYSNDNDIIKNILDDCIEKKSGSYLLNLRARKLRDSIQHNGYEFSEQEGLPFLVGHNVYAVRFKTGIYLSSTEDFDEISSLIKKYKRINSDEITEIDKYDDYEDDFEVLKKIWSYFRNEMSQEDVITKVDAKGKAKTSQQLRDFSYLMEDGMKKIIEEELNISLVDLNLREQFFFLQYAKNVDINKVKELEEFVKKYGEDGLKSFLALEYGTENGIKLLEIDKRLDIKYGKEIFRLYSSIHKKASFLSSILAKNKIFDKTKIPEKLKKEFPKNIYDALLSRATDILSTAYQIVISNKAEAEFYNGKIIEVADIEEVIEAMEVYEDFLEKMEGFIAEEGRYKFDYISSSDYGEVQIYNFTVRDKTDDKEKYSSVSLRETGSNEHLENFEYDGEARINFLFSSEHISSHVKDKSRREATTFRLDRECLVFNESGDNILSKDNTRKDGRLSFDFGSIYDDAGQENNVLGRVMSVGNYYVSQEKKKKPEYYHNKESFYSELGEADVFREIVQTVENFIHSKYIKEAKEKMKE